MQLLDRLLLFLAPPRCAACDRPLARDAVFCAACLTTLEPPPSLPQSISASFSFGGALAEAIRAFKYAPRADLARPLGRLIMENAPARASIDVVVPVPLHPSRLRARGFDQASLLAMHLARALDRPRCLDLLVRVVATPQLAGLDAEARKNTVKSAFLARPCAAGLRVLLVDDVRTTGSTLDAATDALETVGAIVSAHVLAATDRAS